MKFSNIDKNEFGDDCELITDTTLNSDWLNINYIFTDASILSAITNQKISISITNNASTSVDNDYGLLIDRIEMNKNCVETRRQLLPSPYDNLRFLRGRCKHD